jgi:cytochrome c556
MRRSPFLGRAILVLAAVAYSPALAAAADPVKARIESYRELGAAFKNVNDELRKPSPSTMILQLSARQIRSTAQGQYGFFPAGSGPRPGVKTAAKAEIWKQPAQFKTAQDAFNTQAQAFARVAQAGDVAKMRVQAKALGQTCAGCHKTFRVPKD